MRTLPTVFEVPFTDARTLGDNGQLGEIASYLRRCGYTESNSNRLGWYHLRADAIEINPGFTRQPACQRRDRDTAGQSRRAEIAVGRAHLEKRIEFDRSYILPRGHDRR